MRSLTGYRSLIGYQTKEKGTCVQIRGEKLIRLVFWDRIQNSIRPVFWDGGSIKNFEQPSQPSFGLVHEVKLSILEVVLL